MYSVLIVDDHPLICDAYKNAFLSVRESSFNIEIANNSDAALKILEEYSHNRKKLDIAFLDISIPPSKDGKVISGEDLGIKIRSSYYDCKIIVSTTFNDNYRVHSILKSMNPDGFLIKNDIGADELVLAIKTVIEDPPYYSKTVLKLLRNQLSNDFLLDDIDRKILYELSIGTKTKDLKKVIPLSAPAIEKRKRHLKQIFNVESEDRDLILTAKEKGFI